MNSKPTYTFTYKGPVYRFGKIYSREVDIATEAQSLAQAANFMRGKLKKKFNLAKDANLNINIDLIKQQLPKSKEYYEPEEKDDLDKETYVNDNDLWISSYEGYDIYQDKLTGDFKIDGYPNKFVNEIEAYEFINSLNESFKEKKVMNIKEELNRIDHYCIDNDKTFRDLRSMYESMNLSAQDKQEIRNVLNTTNDAETIAAVLAAKSRDGEQNEAFDENGNWTSVYDKFIDIINYVYRMGIPEEERNKEIYTRVTNLYNQHKGDPEWDTAYDNFLHPKHDKYEYVDDGDMSNPFEEGLSENFNKGTLFKIKGLDSTFEVFDVDEFGNISFGKKGEYAGEKHGDTLDNLEKSYENNEISILTPEQISNLHESREIEKYIDLTQPGAYEEVNQYIANGWALKHEGTTLAILVKLVDESMNESANYSLKDAIIDCIDYFSTIEAEFPSDKFSAKSWSDLRDGVEMGVDDDVDVASSLLAYLKPMVGFNRNFNDAFGSEGVFADEIELYNVLKGLMPTNESLDEATLSDMIRRGQLKHGNSLADNQDDPKEVADADAYDPEFGFEHAEDNGTRIQLQDRELRSHHQKSPGKYETSPRVASNTWGRVWKNGELDKQFEGPKYKVRQDMAKYLDKDESLNESNDADKYMIYLCTGEGARNRMDMDDTDTYTEMCEDANEAISVAAHVVSSMDFADEWVDGMPAKEYLDSIDITSGVPFCVAIENTETGEFVYGNPEAVEAMGFMSVDESLNESDEIQLYSNKFYGDYNCCYCDKPLDGWCKVLAKDSDEDGLEWRSFHDECYRKINNGKTPAELYNMYKASTPVNESMNESGGDTTPYTYDEMEYQLKVETNNWTKDEFEGWVKYRDEFDSAMQILSKHYEDVEKLHELDQRTGEELFGFKATRPSVKEGLDEVKNKIDINTAELVGEKIADELNLSDDEYDNLVNNIVNSDVDHVRDRVNKECSDSTKKMFNDLFSDSFKKDYANYAIDNLDEASYGGAYDIADNQFFTSDEILEFAESVVEDLNGLSDAVFTLSQCSLYDNNMLEIGVYCDDEEQGELEEFVNKRIDMRKIRTPQDIAKYKNAIVNEFIKVFDSDHVLFNVPGYGAWKENEVSESLNEDYLGNRDDFGTPYTRDEVEENLRQLTNDFSDESGNVRCYYDQEKNFGREILKKHYHTVEVSDGTRDEHNNLYWIISYSNPDNDLGEEVEMTADELYDKFGTVNVDLINAGSDRDYRIKLKGPEKTNDELYKKKHGIKEADVDAVRSQNKK